MERHADRSVGPPARLRRRGHTLWREVPWAPYAAGVAGVALLLGMLAATSIHRERVRQYERARTQAQTTAHLLEVSVSGLLGEVNGLLASLSAQANEGAIADTPLGMQRLMRSAVGAVPAVWRWTWCREGQVLWTLGAEPSSPPINADTALCEEGPAPAHTGLQVTGPLPRQGNAPWRMVLSRPWQRSATGVRGRIVAELPVDRFERIFGDLQLGVDGAAALRTLSMALVYRHPRPAQEDPTLGTQIVSDQLRSAVRDAPLQGLFTSVTQRDGIERLVAYRRLRDDPFYVLVGYPARDTPQGWSVLDQWALVLAGATVLLAGLSALALYHSSQRRLAAATQRFDALVATSNDAIIAKTLRGTVTSWNAAAERIFGWRADEIVGQSILRLYPPGRRREEDAIVERVRRGERVQHIETERLHADGRRLAVSITLSPLHDPLGRIVGLSMIARDISRQKALEAELRALAFHDALTQLPNRRLFLDRLRHAQEASRRTGEHAGVLFADLDHFKHLNDHHGHEVGDQMLREVAQRLRHTVREHDTVARLGGDEFVVLCERLGRNPTLAAEALHHMAAKLSRVLAEPIPLGPIAWPHGASVGQRLFLSTTEDPEALLRDADRAMYRDKGRRHTESGVLQPLMPPGPAASSGTVDVLL